MVEEKASKLFFGGSNVQKFKNGIQNEKESF